MDHRWHFFKLFVVIFKSWGCHINHSVGDAFWHFSPQLNVFLLRGGLGLGIPWSFMSVEFYKKKYLEYLQGIKWFIGVLFGVFWLKYWTAKVMLKKMFSRHWNLQILGLTVSKTSLMCVIFNLYFFEHSGV